MFRKASAAASLPLCLSLMSLAQGHAFAQVSQVPNAVNFQARIARPDGTPVPDGSYTITLKLFDAASGGTEKWSHTYTNTPVRNGIIAVLIGLLVPADFTGDRWLQIQIGSDPALTPRQKLLSVAYAFKAGSVADNAITSGSLQNNSVTTSKIADGSIGTNKLGDNSVTPLKLADNSVTTGKVVDGSLTLADFAPGIFNPLAWLLGGNTGTLPGTHFLGTTDDQALVFKVNNSRAMRYRYVQDVTGGYSSVNILGGSEVNSVGANVEGATIAGGGKDSLSGTDDPNSVTADFGTVGGGSHNAVAGTHAVIAGGDSNTASGSKATVGGGSNNTASGELSSILGGGTNVASNSYATVLGGFNNQATGAYGVAMGRNARSLHTGTFVFNNNLGTFTSTGNNQFLIQADGGVGIGTSSPNALLDVGGNAHFALNVGIGTTSPITKLHVEGSLHLSGTTQDISTDVGSNLQFGHYDGTTFTERMLIDGTGHVGINDTNPTYRLELPNIATDGEGRARANRWDTYSSGRWKHNVVPIENALDKVLRMRGVMFDWNPEHGGTRDIGFVAEEVGNVIPELVSWEVPGKAAFGMAYDRVTALLVEAVKSLKKENDALRAEKTAEVTDLRTRLEALESVVRSLQTQPR